MALDFSALEKPVQASSSGGTNLDFAAIDTPSVGEAALHAGSESLQSLGKIMGTIMGTAALYPASGVAGMADFAANMMGGQDWRAALENAGKTAQQVQAIPGRVFLGADLPYQNNESVMPLTAPVNKPEMDVMGAVTLPFEKLAELNAYISGANEEGQPSALRYAAGMIPEALVYSGAAALGLGGFNKAIKVPALSRLMAGRTAAAEKAGVPSAAPSGGVVKYDANGKPVVVGAAPPADTATAAGVALTGAVVKEQGGRRQRAIADRKKKAEEALQAQPPTPETGKPVETVPEQLDLGLIPKEGELAKQTGKAVGPEQLSLDFTAVEEPKPAVEAPPSPEPGVSALTPEEMQTVARMGYKILDEEGNPIKKEINAVTPDEWRARIAAAQKGTGAPPPEAATVHQKVIEAEKAKYEQQNADIRALQEMGIERLSEDSPHISEMSPSQLRRAVEAIKEGKPVTEAHAANKVRIARLQKVIEEYEAKIDSGELDADVNYDLVNKIYEDARYLKKLSDMSDEDLRAYFDTELVQKPEELGPAARDLRQDLAKYEDLTDEELDAEIDRLHSERVAAEPIVPPVGEAVPATKEGEVKAGAPAKVAPAPKTAEDFNKILEAEGMPEELPLGEEPRVDISGWEGRRQNALKMFEEARKYYEGKPITSNAVNTSDRLVSAYRGLFDSQAEMGKVRRVIEQAEKDYQLVGRRKARINQFKREELINTIRDATKDTLPDIQEAHIKLAETIIDSLKNEPTFRVNLLNKDMEGERYNSVGGVYRLTSNMISVKDPLALAHEVSHWAFWNVLSGKERLQFFDSFVENNYKDGKLDIKGVKNLATDSSNTYTISEVFASRMADYFKEYVLTPAEKPLLRKVMMWFEDLINTLKGKGVTRDYTDVKDIFDRVWETTGERHKWTGEGELEPGMTPIGVAEAVNKGSITLDSLGLQSAYEKVASWAERIKRFKDGQATHIVQELQGEKGPQLIYKTDKPPDLKLLSEWTMTPIVRYRGTAGEKPVFDLMSANQYSQWAAHQHYSVLRDLQKGLTTAERENVRKVLEGKIPGNPAEQKAAVGVRGWLDGMRTKYQEFLRDQYMKHLSKGEQQVVSSLIAGEDILRINAKAKRLKVDMEVAMGIASEYRKIDNWGLDDYITRVELGRWKILDEKGKVVAVGLSEGDAVRKATDYLETHPDVTKLQLDDSFIPFGDEASALTRKQYFAIINKIKNGLMENVEGLSKGVAKKLAEKGISRQFTVAPTKVWSPFAEPRRNVLQGEADVFPVLFAYARSMERKMNLDPVLDDIKKVSADMPVNMREGLIRLAEDVKGRMFQSEKIVDEVLKAVKIDAGPRALSQAVGNIKSGEAKLKLGYRPVAAAVNLMSGQAHVWTKVGTGYYLKAAQFLRTSEGRAFIKSEEPYFGVNVIEDAVGNIKPESKSLRMFQAAEVPNRRMGLAANYLLAKDKFGLSEEAAREFARKANWFQNFTYDMASLPRTMRGPVGRLTTQFKPYLVKEMEFVSGLKGWEIPRYITAQLMLAGPKGYLTLLRSLPILGALAAWDQAEEWMNKELPRLSRGVGGAVGVDVTGAASIQFPDEPLELVGPAIADLSKIYTTLVKPLMEGVNVGGKDVKKTLMGISPAVRYWWKLMDQVVDKDGWVKNEKGQRLYQLPESPFEKALEYGKLAAGAESLESSRQKTAERIAIREDKINELNRTIARDRALDIFARGDKLPPEVIEELRIYGITARSIVRAEKFRMLTPQQRAVFLSEVRKRAETMKGWPSPEDYTY